MGPARPKAETASSLDHVRALRRVEWHSELLEENAARAGAMGAASESKAR